ncbi:DNA-directed RNA polymerase III subunit 1 [Glycine max]|nr:DNA-directed RNA polymerase III subunit 1 [Glycine max]
MNRARTEGITFTKEPFMEDTGPRKIKNMKFSTLSESEISKIAEVQVWKGSYYDSFKKPIHGGLLDPRMGPANKSLVCATCDGNFHDCPGHYGYLNLALPVFNVGYLSTIVEILKCICKGCARILLDEDTRKKHLKKMRSSKKSELDKIDFVKVRVIKDCSKVVNCPRCGYINGSVKKLPASLTIIHDCSKCRNYIVEELDSALSRMKDSRATTNVSNRILNPFQVLSLFKRMLDEDCELLYVAERPEKLIMTNVVVPPIAIRPSVVMDESLSNENDITERLKNIIQANAVLRQELQESTFSSKFLDGWDILQNEVAQFINSDVRGIPFYMQPTKQLAGFVQRLKGKHGRFRGNLSGKRVEYTGRTVISPDPNLKISEVAIPIHMARILTYPERVTHHNIEKLRQCVRNGPDKYPGARMLRRDGGHSWSLKVLCRKRAADELRIGDIVDRHLEDGDIVLFNRQPSLHRMSIMCHRARIMPWRTLRFNESVCNPYNADFDGDEMNLHVPQTEEARTEAILLMGVENNLCTPKNGEILVASTQDFLTSSFLITRKDTFYDRSTFSLICSYIGDGMDPIDLPTPAIVKPVELWSGKQLFSIILRPHANMRVYVNLTVKERNYTEDKKIKDKKIEWKTLCPNDGFVYFRNSELISGQVGKVTLGNGNKDGLFSVLLRDYRAHAAASCMNRLAKLSARWIGNHGFSIGIDDVQPKEILINKKDETISEGYRECDKHIEAFNKGKLELLAGCDAAQTLETRITGVLNGLRDTAGKVCMQTLHWRNSPLIMSQCGSKGSSINISQMVACVGQQSVGGRRTPNGFIDRSLPHFPRKSKTPAAKGFVANSFYSGLSATEFFFHTMGGREGLVDTAVKTADTGYMSRQLMKSLEDLFLHYDYTVRNAGGSIVQFCYGDDGMDPAGMEGKNGKPLNFERLFLKSKAICPNDEDDEILSSSDVSKVVHEKLSEFDMSRLAEKGVFEVGFSADFVESLQSFIKDNAKLTEEGFTDEHSQNLKKFGQRISGITRKQLDVFLNICLSRYHSKKMEAGAPVGATGAHSIGEPGTQMTLKTFHFAGVASMNVTLGVPRVKEIMNGNKKISTPIITAILERDDNANTARIVKGRIEKTNLGQVAKSIKVVMTSRSASVVITLDMKRIQDAHLNIDANIVKESILRTKKTKLKPEHIKILDIKKLEVVPQDVDRSKIHFQLHYLKNLLPTVVVKGIKTVDRVVISKDTKAEKFRLLVEGTGFREVMGVEGIDGRKTVSNHIHEVRDTLGIEAARESIVKEIKYTMVDTHGMNIDIRHMMLLADMMTATGHILGINRFGISKMGKSVLMLASFERTADILFQASVRGRDDSIGGVSESIIMGIPIQIGTGMIKVKQRTFLCLEMHAWNEISWLPNVRTTNTSPTPNSPTLQCGYLQRKALPESSNTDCCWSKGSVNIVWLSPSSINFLSTALEALLIHPKSSYRASSHVDNKENRISFGTNNRAFISLRALSSFACRTPLSRFKKMSSALSAVDGSDDTLRRTSVAESSICRCSS